MKPTQTLTNKKDTEADILGLLLQHPDIADEIMAELKPNMFSGQNRIIYNAMVELAESDLELDCVVISKKTGISITELITIENQSAGKSSVPYMLKSLKDAYGLEQINNLLLWVRSEIANNTEVGSYELLVDMGERIQKLQQIIEGGSDIKHIEDIVTEVRSIADRAYKGDRGIATGYSGLDKYIVGFQRGDFVVLAGRPSVGKTSFALNLVENITLKRKIPILFVSIEMSGVALAQRLISSQANVSNYSIRRGMAKNDEDTSDIKSDNEWNRFLSACIKLSNSDIYIYDSTPVTPAVLRHIAKVAKNKGVEMVVIDYLGLMESGKKTRSRVEDVTEISRCLKLTAKDLNIPFLVLSQLSRAPEKGGRKPVLSDLRDSGAIEQDADIVMFLHKTGDEVELIIAKNRQGATATVNLKFEPKRTRFLEIDNYHVESEVKDE